MLRVFQSCFVPVNWLLTSTPLKCQQASFPSSFPAGNANDGMTHPQCFFHFPFERCWGVKCSVVTRNYPLSRLSSSVIGDTLSEWSGTKRLVTQAWAYKHVTGRLAQLRRLNSRFIGKVAGLSRMRYHLRIWLNGRFTSPTGNAIKHPGGGENKQIKLHQKTKLRNT